VPAADQPRPEPPPPAADPGATDPFADLFAHLRSGYAAAKLHLSILAEEALAKVYRELLFLYLAALGILFVFILSVLGAYHLVSGTAQAIIAASGHVWLGHVLVGILFLSLPALGGWLIAGWLRQRRIKRLEERYQALQQGDPP
jgi:hypothetical protein